MPKWTSLPKKPESSQAPPIETPDPDRSQIHRLLNEQDYAGAMELIQAEIRKGTNESRLSKEYLQASNGGLGQAKTLMQQGHYFRAAFLLKNLRATYPRTPELQQQVATTPTQLTADIALCTQNLMEAGLVAYRAGELSTALDIWQQILAVDPQHQAAKNASQTTQQQLLKLKTLNGNK